MALSTSPADAHYHPVNEALAKWKAFQAAMGQLVTNSPAERHRVDLERIRQTTYFRGILGRH